MSPTDQQLDVLILGEHPSAMLAAAVLRSKTKLGLLHATIPGDDPPDRLALINPELFKLHELLKPLDRKLNRSPVYGIRFLGDAADTASEHRAPSAEADVAFYSDIRRSMKELAEKQGVESVSPTSLEIHRVDEKGVEISLDGKSINPRMLIVAGELPSAQRKMLAMPAGWEDELIFRYTFVRFRPEKMPELSARPTVPMSLNLAGTEAWAWMFALDGQVQLSCSIGIAVGASGAKSTPDAPAALSGVELLRAWDDTLRRHDIFDESIRVPFDDAQSVNLPLGGALAHEGVASRTLLIGPAGGFYSACAEDVYPGCWSAIFAVDVARKALLEPHLQDALNPFRHRWRTTLGEYLRGPQQNLRFLLPLVYRNPVMTTRLAEAILAGKSVVR